MKFVTQEKALPQAKQEREEMRNYDSWMRRSKLDVRIDPVFKYVFSRQVDETLKHAAYVIQTMLGIIVHTIKQMDRDSYNIHPNAKQVRFDSAFLVNEKTHVIVEMQRQHEINDNQRFSRYANVASMHALVAGNNKQTYREGSVFVITILGYGIANQERAKQENWLYRRYANGDKYCADEIIVPVELVGLQPLLKKDVDALTDLECLKLWLAYSHKKEYEGVMKKILDKKEDIKAMEKTLQNVMNSEEFFFTLLDIVDEYCDKEAELMYKEMYEEEQKLREEEKRLKEEQKQMLEEEKRLKEEEQKKRQEIEMTLDQVLSKLGMTQEDIDAFLSTKNTVDCHFK